METLDRYDRMVYNSGVGSGESQLRMPVPFSSLPAKTESEFLWAAILMLTCVKRFRTNFNAGRGSSLEEALSLLIDLLGDVEGEERDDYTQAP